MKTKNRFLVLVVVIMAFALIAGGTYASTQVAQTPLAGKSIPKYVEPVPTFVGARVQAAGITVSMEEFPQQVLPAGYPMTTVWGYKVGSAPAFYPGYTLEAHRGTPATITYINNLVNPVLQTYLTVDQTIHWADPSMLMCQFYSPAVQQTMGCFQPFAGPVPTVVHLHGAEVPSAFDGGPDQWFTPGAALKGAGYVSDVYTYPNNQEATTLWFHDHALGMTRLNVYGGLAGFYFLRDNRDTGLADNPIGLPAGNEEVELLIQDRQFDTNGQWLFPDGFPCGINGCPPNPTVHPFWNPEFFGDVIVVNGKAWPYLQVEAKRYRFRFLNGSNARMYDLQLSNKMPFWQIGTDGGFLDTPVMVNKLFIAPGERADVVVDFTGLPAGTSIILTNDAKAPFPSGAPADPQTVGQIMQFRIVSSTGADTSCNPALVAGATSACGLRANPIVRLADPVAGTRAPGVTANKKRQLILKEIEGPGGPLMVLLNNTHWHGLKDSTLTSSSPVPVSGSVQIGAEWMTELPQVGSTEEWEIINTTADAHPIHIHLVQFQLINRQTFQANKYMKAYTALPGDGSPNPYNTPNADGALGGNPAVTPFLQNGASPPRPNEAGWKDTFVMLPGQVTRVAVRWAPQATAVGAVSPGTNLYSFDPTATMGQTDFAGYPGGPGYVWHCHILDHEDNEMMRPYMVMP